MALAWIQPRWAQYKDGQFLQKTTEVQQFVGFVQYARKFIKQFNNVIATPLTNLTNDKTCFKWTHVEQDAFKKL